MNKNWSELNKAMQLKLKKCELFSEGIDELLALRKMVMKQISDFRSELSDSDFSAIPCINAKGYHSKTVAYSLWHIFRIEDIVTHTLIVGDEQIFFKENYQKRTGSPIITTGNELVKKEIAEFSEQLDIDELYLYIAEVDKSTSELLKKLTFEDLKTKITNEKRNELCRLRVVSDDENAAWLIDYWCGKDVRGLIQMPLSRHWIMHVEACARIRDKVKK